MDKIKKLLMIVVGTGINAFGVAAFILPNNFLVGGVTGIGRVFWHYFNMNISYVIGVISVILLIVGWYFLGKKFAMTIILGTFLFPAFINIFQRFDTLTHLTNDPVIAAIYGGLVAGLGLGMIIRAGASSGGSDVIPIIINRKVGWPVAPMLYLSDFLILMMQCPFATKENILMGIFLTLLVSLTVNKVVVFGNSDVQFTIISDKFEEINEALHQEVNVGTTLLHSQSGYYKNETNVIVCIVRHEGVNAVKSTILKVDPYAFMTMVNVTEVKGKGFSFGRV